MNKNLLKEKLNAGQPTFGPFVGHPAPQVVEMIGWMGFDFVIIDCEHGPMDYETAENMIRAAEVSRTTPIVRIGLNEPQHIQRFMDAGAAGVLIPLINNSEQARRAVDAVKYPPIGKRGAYGGRSAMGGLQNFAEYIKQANEETFVGLQIETPEAIKNQDEIINTPHTDLIFFGPGDLSVNFGKPGKPEDPEVVSAIEKLVKKTSAAGVHCGTLAGSGDQAKFWHDRGVNWLVSSTTRFMSMKAQEYLSEVRAAVSC